jgi:hypothetical protein
MDRGALNEVERWLKQRKPIQERIAELIVLCINNNMKPGEVHLSTDLFREMCRATERLSGQHLDPEQVTAIDIQLGNHPFSVVKDEKMPQASIHVVKTTE